MEFIIFQGWKNDYALTKENAEKMTSAILQVLSDNYTTDEGATMFQGQALSIVADELRIRRFVVPGLRTDQKRLYEALGFTIKRARGFRRYRGGSYKPSTLCDCVTI